MTTANDVVEPAATPVPAALRSLTLRWVATALVLFPVLVLLGLLMRAAQSDLVPDLDATRFYSVMTLHGVGMVGLWYTAGMASVCFLLSRYVRVSIVANRIGFVATLVGVALLLVSTLIGKFGAGWYFLYPLPTAASRVPGKRWATATFFASLAVLGVGWTMVVPSTSCAPLPSRVLASGKPSVGATSAARSQQARCSADHSDQHGQPSIGALGRAW